MKISRCQGNFRFKLPGISSVKPHNIVYSFFLRYTSVCFIALKSERGVIVFEYIVVFCILAWIWGALLSPSYTNGNGEHFDEDPEEPEDQGTYVKRIDSNEPDTASTIASLVWSVVFACALMYSALVCHYVVLVPLFFTK